MKSGIRGAVLSLVLLALAGSIYYGWRTRTYAILVRDGLAAEQQANLSLQQELATSRLQITKGNALLEQSRAESAALAVRIPSDPGTSGAWIPILENAPFEPRDGGSVASFKGYIWLTNGWSDQPFQNSIWRSPDGQRWDRIVAVAPWSSQSQPTWHFAPMFALNDRLWVIRLADGETWSSHDGEHWTKEEVETPWAGRYGAISGVFGGRVWIMGGQDDTAHGLTDVWSSGDGRNWRLETANAPWPGRALISGLAVLDGSMWIYGGGLKATAWNRNPPTAETLAELSDVWRSSNGRDWELVNPRGAWLPRTHASIAGYDDHLIITDGSVGVQENTTNEAWSSRDGVKWTGLGGAPRQRFPPRHASMLVEHNGSLFMIAGYMHNDVWRLDGLVNDP